MNEEEKVGLSEPMIRVTTPICIVCRQSSVVILTRQEFRDVAENKMPIQQALPDRTTDFRELVVSGMHHACWTRRARGAGER